MFNCISEEFYPREKPKEENTSQVLLPRVNNRPVSPLPPRPRERRCDWRRPLSPPGGRRRNRRAGLLRSHVISGKRLVELSGSLEQQRLSESFSPLLLLLQLLRRKRNHEEVNETQPRFLLHGEHDRTRNTAARLGSDLRSEVVLFESLCGVYRRQTVAESGPANMEDKKQSIR